MPRSSPPTISLLVASGSLLPLVAVPAVAIAEDPSLCVVAEESCMAVGGLSVRIELSPGEDPIVAGQFSVLYDAAALDFTGISPGATCDHASPFKVEIFESVDETAGEIFYAVIVDPFEWDRVVPQTPTTIACLNFAITGSSLSEICLFDSMHPALTMLVDSDGSAVPIDNTADCPTDGGAPLLSCAGVDVDEDCLCMAGTADCSALSTDCRVGVCNEDTNRCETTIINNFGPCDDGSACTASDLCVDGSCIGSGSTCPSLCVVAEESCMALGGLTVRIELSPGDEPVMGGQFSVLYDPDALEFSGAWPGVACDPASPFALEIFESADRTLGAIAYSVVVSPLEWQPDVPQVTTTLACLNFATTGSSQSEICLFGGVNPTSTMLVGGAGNQVPIDNTAVCPTDAGGSLLSCASVDVDEDCVCVGGTPDCSALDTDCQMGVCDEYNGVCERRIINEYGPCDDGEPCTESDTCIDGSCVGFGCESPSLCVDAGDGCAFVGETIQVTVELGEGDRIINGGQFSIQYDPAGLEFVAISPGRTCAPASPFGLEIFTVVDEVKGMIFYTVLVDPGVGMGTAGPATMACLTFVLQGSAGEGVCLLEGINPYYTILIDDSGNAAHIYNANDCPTGLPSPIISCARPCIPIPTLSGWGLVIMATLLLLAAKVRFGLAQRRRSRDLRRAV